MPFKATDGRKVNIRNHGRFYGQRISGGHLGKLGNVFLGKTIEAGLVISQKWAERQRRILVITPANLRKQWHQELTEKFFLPCAILETKSYNAAIKTGNFRPFETKDTVVICSYQFARSKAADVHVLPWDLVVIDEAHRLRNVYKPSNKIANVLKQALASHTKLLSFRDQFANLSQDQVFKTLKERLKPVCHRTLRRQVTVIRLEGYEDTLNNLRLRRTPEQEAALAKGGETVRDQYLLGYFLDVESADSASQLDLAQFRDPFAYKLNIATSSAGETKETTVDLVETFQRLMFDTTNYESLL